MMYGFYKDKKDIFDNCLPLPPFFYLQFILPAINQQNA